MRAAIVLLLAASAASAQARFEWPKVPVIEAAPAAQIVHVRGVPVQLVALKVKEDAHRLLQTYADAFYAAHLYLAPDKDQLQLAAGGAMLTALDPATNITYTVILKPRPDGTTTVILGEANFARRDPTKETDFAPIFPGATGVVRSSQEANEVIAFSAHAAAREIEGFYRTVLPTLGYRQDPKDSSVWQRGSDRVQLTTAPNQDVTSVVLVLHKGAGP